MPINRTLQAQIVREEVLKIVSNVGSGLGENVAKLYEDGVLVPGQHITVIPEIGSYHLSSPTLLTKVSERIGSGDYYEGGNVCLATGGVAIIGVSGMRLACATDDKAKACYALSMVCGACGLVGGSMAAHAKAFHFSKTAIVSDACGYVFMKIGDEAQRLAEKIERRPERIRRPMTFGGYTGKSAFIVPSNFSTSNFISKIPFERIGRSVGLALTVYTYSKIGIIVYRYGRRLILGYRNNYKSKKIQKSVKLFISLTYLECRTLKIYRFAVI